MSKKTTHNPIPSGTKTLHDVLPETQNTVSSPESKTTIKKKDIHKESPLKTELNSLYEDLKRLKVDGMDSDDEDERERLLDRIQEVIQMNYKAIDKAAKGTINTHRDWDTQDEGIKEKSKKLKDYQSQIEVYKKTIKGLKNRLNALTNMEKMVHVTNELKDSERVRKQLEDQVRILQRNKYQTKALSKLTDDTDYESKMKSLNDELNNLKEQYKQMAKDHKEEETAQLEHHKKLVAAEEENARLKRILIALKNNKDPFDGINDMEEVIQNAKKEVQAYEQAEKSEDKRHKFKMKKLAETKQSLNTEIEELQASISE